METDSQPTSSDPADGSLAPRRRVPAWGFAVAGAALPGILVAVALFFSSPAAPAPASAPRVGELSLLTEPPGASVTVDGQVRGQTPLTMPTDAHGATYSVRVELEGYRPVEQYVTLAAGASERLNISLRRLPAALEIVSTPAGATVQLDGRQVGRTPLELSDLPVGRVVVSLSLAGYGPWSANVDLAAGSTVERSVRLEPLPATLEVSASVAGAKVLLDGQEKGEAPLTLSGLKSANYELRLQTPDQPDWVGYLWLAPGETRQVAVDLTPPQPTERAPEPLSHGIAVVVENQENARPQSGLDHADIVYEALAEGGISRFLALYLTEDAPAIGPVRSGRHYFVNWAHEYDAAIVHIGASPQGFDAIAGLRTPDLDESRGDAGFWRSRERYAPHNAYTSVSGITSGMGAGLPEGSWGGFKFKEPGWRYPGEQVTEALIDYGWQYRVEWRFEPESNQYLRRMAGAPHLDAQTGKQLRATSVVVMRVPTWVIDAEGRLDMAMVGAGQADYFLDGVHLAGSWTRRSLNDVTSYLDEEGRQVRFSPGPIWVQVLPESGSLHY